MIDKNRKKLRKRKSVAVSKKDGNRKTIFVYMDSRFVGESQGSGPLRLDGTELGFFGRRSKSEKAKRKWYCSVVFNSTRLNINSHGERYRFKVLLLELFDNDYSLIAEERESVPGAVRPKGEVREVSLEFEMTLYPEYNLDKLPHHCPQDAMSTLINNKILVDFRLLSPDQASLSDLQVDRLTELVWWIALQVPARKMIFALEKERISTLKSEIGTLNEGLEVSRNSIHEAKAERSSAAVALRENEVSLADVQLEAESKISLAQLKIDGIQSKIDENKRLVAHEEIQVAAAIAKALKKPSGREQENESREKIKVEAERRTARIEYLKSDCLKLQSELKRAQYQMSRVKRDLDAARSLAQSKVRNTKAFLSEIDSYVERLQQEVTDTLSEIVKKNSEIAKFDSNAS